MATVTGMESVFGFPFQTVVEGKRGIKMEEEHLPGPMQCKGWEEEAPCAICGGNVRGILPRVTGEHVKQEPGEGMLQRWDDQWQTFLKTMESPLSEPGNSLSPEKSAPWGDAQAFLAAFEQVAEACRWPKEECRWKKCP
ncbi:hypothetical protein JD844_013765 [Phrynosoma platyrhinos]|uniref:Uncharacterized protein n=1 Tax=Phrynosoma platyrhinos TaxID=52577 RepID=A0ABQ7TMB5_PHRPL|nr:hypothetical protein JD844_013765 [Phrynosoma platyrhinos]